MKNIPALFRAFPQLSLTAFVLTALPLAVSAQTAGAASSAPANAGTATTAATPMAALKPAEEKFIMKAGKSGQHEIMLSQLATERASDAQVRAFAQKLVTDHEAMANELNALAAAKGVTVPSSDTEMADHKKLMEKTGIDFDEAYLKKMIDAHEDAIDLFKKAAKDDDARIQGFANKYLPALRDHLAMAKQLKKNLRS